MPRSTTKALVRKFVIRAVATGGFTFRRHYLAEVDGARKVKWPTALNAIALGSTVKVFVYRKCSEHVTSSKTEGVLVSELTVRIPSDTEQIQDALSDRSKMSSLLTSTSVA